MSNAGRWCAVLIALLLALCIVGLGAYAGGPEHHHGDEIGTHGIPPAGSH